MSRQCWPRSGQPGSAGCRAGREAGRTARPRTTTHDRPRTTTHDRPRTTTHDHEWPRMTDHARTTAHDRPRTTTHDHARSCTTAHDRARPRTTTHDHARPRTTTNDNEWPRMTDHARTTAHDRARPTTHDHARPHTTTHDRPRTTTHGHARPCTTTHDDARRRTTTHDDARPRTTTHDHAWPRMTTHDRPRTHDRARTTDHARPRTTTHDRARQRTTVHDRARPRMTDHARPPTAAIFVWGSGTHPTPGGFRGLNCPARLALARERTPSLWKSHGWALLFNYSSTCHERTPSGPGKSVRTLQVAARSSQGRTGRRGTPNIIHLAIVHNTITTSDIPNEYTHCHNQQTTARKFERYVGPKFGCAPAIFG